MFRADAIQIKSASGAYDDWWLALAWIRNGLIAGGMLREIEVTAAMPKLRPWVAHFMSLTIFLPGLLVVFLTVHSSVVTMSQKHSVSKCGYLDQSVLPSDSRRSMTSIFPFDRRNVNDALINTDHHIGVLNIDLQVHRPTCKHPQITGVLL
jgi:hypothetical protein